MKVFATKFLESMSEENVKESDWSWTPEGDKAKKIYGSGNNTSSNMSTYAQEKDSRSDSDRPNEGLYVA